MYADVSGYTDIALGAALILGIELSENFNRPFSSHSITEYWRRWHISISTWFRDYVYFPLAYSKKKTGVRRYAALFSTFLVSGLWHGATWPFFAFGLTNATYRVLDGATAGARQRVWSAVDALKVPWLSGALQIILTFCLTVISLLFFGAPSIGAAWFVLTHLTQGLGALLHLSYIQDQLLIPASIGINSDIFIGVILAIAAMEIVQYLAARGRSLQTYPRSVRWGAYVALLVMIATFGNFGGIPFIYFRF
jgi:alginate O-acetyltransferase complex protein AlgI